MHAAGAVSRGAPFLNAVAIPLFLESLAEAPSFWGIAPRKDMAMEVLMIGLTAVLVAVTWALYKVVVSLEKRR